MTDMKSVYRCRKCRYELFDTGNLLELPETADAQYDQSLWYLDPDPCPVWMQVPVEESGFTRGKLSCPKCNAKVGAFNFISPYKSNLSPIHIIKCRVDLILPVPTSERKLTSGLPAFLRSCAMAASTNAGNVSGSPQLQTSVDNIQALNVEASNEPSSSIALIPHRRSLSVGALAPFLASASNLNSSLTLSNPLALLSRNDTHRTECAEEDAGPSLLDNLFAFGQAAVEAANLTTGADDNSDEDEVEAPVTLVPQVENVDNDQGTVLQNVELLVQDGTNQTTTEPVNQDATDSCEVAPEVIPDMTENYRLMCPVCLDPYYNPHKCLPCKHVFCDPCLRRMRKSDMNSATRCPLCRIKIKKCVPHTGLSASVTSTFPDVYRNRHKAEKKQKHKLPPLPGDPVTIDNKFGQNMLATWSAVCGVVLVMMFVFCVFASLVGFVLWYTMEVVLDVVGELFMEISDLFSFSWQALIILYIDGKIPHDIKEVLSGTTGRIFGTFDRLINRTKVFFTEGEVPPPQVTLYVNDPNFKFNNTTHLLTKVTQANVANYVFLAGLVTYVLYRVARYLQNMNAQPVQVR